MGHLASRTNISQIVAGGSNHLLNASVPRAENDKQQDQKKHLAPPIHLVIPETLSVEIGMGQLFFAYDWHKPHPIYMDTVSVIATAGHAETLAEHGWLLAAALINSQLLHNVWPNG